MSDPEQRFHSTKLNLGCGFDHRPGFVNVDFLEDHGPDIVADVRLLEGFPTDFFDHILAQDILEHLPRTDCLPTLTRWSELLCPGGTLELRVPDVIGIAGLLQQHRAPQRQEELLRNLYGTQAYEGDFHLNGFTAVSLTTALESVGLHVTSLERRDGWLLDCLATKPTEASESRGSVPVAHLMSADERVNRLDPLVTALGSLLPEQAGERLRPLWRRARSRITG